ncbi:LemA family protein [Coleofasciculus sp. H7-2]|uniref:LemA family protein n=1 Tax=Coleofasciculus sp. H7-2 TaxID=3351545 RepID=UPI003670740E
MILPDNSYEVKELKRCLTTQIGLRYNQVVQNYNQKVKQFPNVILAPIFGFKPQPFYPAKTSG